jgi:predicted ABC-type transport system involved in lysophospholipase L1 biosynthesis ATPase subunit
LLTRPSTRPSAATAAASAASTSVFDDVFALLRRVNRERGTSVLFVTHNPQLAARCDKTIMVVDGLVVEPAGAGG